MTLAMRFDVNKGRDGADIALLEQVWEVLVINQNKKDCLLRHLSTAVAGRIQN